MPDIEDERSQIAALGFLARVCQRIPIQQYLSKAAGIPYLLDGLDITPDELEIRGYFGKTDILVHRMQYWKALAALTASSVGVTVLLDCGRALPLSRDR